MIQNLKVKCLTVSWTMLFCAFGRYLLKGQKRQLCQNGLMPDSVDFNKNVVAIQFELEEF